MTDQEAVKRILAFLDPSESEKVDVMRMLADIFGIQVKEAGGLTAIAKELDEMAPERRETLREVLKQLRQPAIAEMSGAHPMAGMAMGPGSREGGQSPPDLISFCSKETTGEMRSRILGAINRGANTVELADNLVATWDITSGGWQYYRLTWSGPGQPPGFQREGARSVIECNSLDELLHFAQRAQGYLAISRIGKEAGAQHPLAGAGYGGRPPGTGQDVS